MRILQESSTDEVLGSTVVTSLRKRAATVVGVFLLATSFTLAGGPAAAASPSTGLPYCGGQRPGSCPGWPPGPGMHLMCGGLPGMCPGDRPGPGQTRRHLAERPDTVPFTRCAGQTPGICP